MESVENNSFGEVVEINLSDYFSVLKDKFWQISLLSLTCAAATFLISQLIQVPTYKASTTLLIDTHQQTVNDDNLGLIRASESLARTYAELLQSRRVLDTVATQLELDVEYDEFKALITAEPIARTQLLIVSATSQSPDDAAAIANLVTQIFIDQNNESQTSVYVASQDNLASQLTFYEQQITIATADLNALNRESLQTDIAERNRLQGILTELNQSYTSLLQSYENVRLKQHESAATIVQVDAAVPPTDPINSNSAQYAIIIGFLSFALAVFIISIRELLDDTIKNSEELSRLLEIPMLGQTTTFDAESIPLITHTHPSSVSAEEFRSLRINLKYAGVDKSLRKLLVTSPVSSSGKTTLAANLAIVMANAGETLTIIDGDLRRPKLHELFSVSNQAGVSTLFIESLNQIEDVLQQTKLDKLSILTAGRTPPNPSELLDSERASLIIDAALSDVDKIIIDAPPVMAITDALALSQHVDGVILVLRAGETKKTVARQAVERLRRVGANVIGFVIMDVGRTVSDQRDHKYYSQSDYGTFSNKKAEPVLMQNGYKNGAQPRPVEKTV